MATAVVWTDSGMAFLHRGRPRAPPDRHFTVRSETRATGASVSSERVQRREGGERWGASRACERTLSSSCAHAVPFQTVTGRVYTLQLFCREGNTVG